MRIRLVINSLVMQFEYFSDVDGVTLSERQGQVYHFNTLPRLERQECQLSSMLLQRASIRTKFASIYAEDLIGEDVCAVPLVCTAHSTYKHGHRQLSDVCCTSSPMVNAISSSALTRNMFSQRAGCIHLCMVGHEFESIRSILHSEQLFCNS
jgi:hypothetical protein